MNNNKKLFLIIKALLIIICIKSTSFASEIVVYRNESMPWCGTINGKNDGITVDILNEITKHGGPKFKFITLPWARAQYKVKQNKCTSIIPLTRTKAREKHYKWIVKLVPNQIRFTITNKPKMQVKRPSSLTLSAFKPLKIGVIRGSAIIPNLIELGFNNIEEVNTAEMNAKKLSYGRIDAMVESEMVDIYLWNRIGQKKEDLIAGPAIGEVKYIYLGAALNFPQDIIEKVRIAMDKIRKNGILDKIYRKWKM